MIFFMLTRLYVTAKIGSEIKDSDIDPRTSKRIWLLVKTKTLTNGTEVGGE